MQNEDKYKASISNYPGVPSIGSLVTTVYRPLVAIALFNDRSELILTPQKDGISAIYCPCSVTIREENIYCEASQFVENVLDEYPTLELAGNLFPIANFLALSTITSSLFDVFMFAGRVEGVCQSLPYHSNDKARLSMFSDWYDLNQLVSNISTYDLPASASFGLEKLTTYKSKEKLRRYKEVLVGGTFDRLHKGHKALLKKAFDVGDAVYIGVATDRFVANSDKQLKEMIEPYMKRKNVLRRYLFSMGLLGRAVIMPLNDALGEKAMDPSVKAIIVSTETVQGAIRINKIRELSKLSPITIEPISMVCDDRGETISSTHLRMREQES